MAEARPIAPGLFVVDAGGPRLLAGRCPACARLHFPAGPSCPYCGSAGCEQVPVGPAARLWLFTTVTSRPPGYAGPVPYGFGVVELPEGLRIVTRLGEARGDRLRAGMPMRLALEPLLVDDTGQAVTTYVFRPEAP